MDEMKSKSTSISLSTLIFFLVCMVLGGMLGFSILDAFGGDLCWWQLVGRLLEGLVLFLLAFFIQVFLHEIGHMIAGLLRGWTFISFTILGIVLSRRDGKFYLSRFAVPGVGGQCLMMPPQEGDTDLSIAFYNAGGILMNAFVSLLVGSLLIVYYDPLLWGLRVFLASLCISGIFFVIVNGVPSAAGGIPNDGMNIRELNKDSFSTHVFLTTMRCMGKLQQGYRIEDVVDGYLTDGVTLDYANPIHAVAVNFDISLAIAQLDFKKAHSIYKRMSPRFDRIVSIYQKEITYEKVFLFLVSPCEGVDVGLMIDSDTLNYFEMQTHFRPTALRVKYAFARLYECDEEKAESVYKQFQEVCEHYHIPGEVYSEKRLIEYVRGLEPLEA